MRPLLFLCCLFLWASVRAQVSRDLQKSDLLAVDLPLDLSKIDWNDSKSLVQISDWRRGRIQEVVNHYYAEECSDLEGLYTPADCYLGTLWLRGASRDFYYVLLRHPVGGYLSARVFLPKGEGSLRQNLFAMYEFEEEKLRKTKLFKSLELQDAQVQISDVDGDGREDLTLVRLFHNGTFNAKETLVVNFEESGVDTLHFRREGIH